MSLMDLKLRLGLPISKQRSFEEELELDKASEKLIEDYEPLRKDEREKIFLENGSVTLGEAFEAKRSYLAGILKAMAKKYFNIQLYNEKYPEFPLDLPNLKKAQNDYDWHLKLNSDNQKLDIEGVKVNRRIGEFVKITRGFVSCPFHQERTPSLKVNKEETLWHCFGCNRGGDIITFIMLRENLNFIDAVKYLQ